MDDQSVRDLLEPLVTTVPEGAPEYVSTAGRTLMRRGGVTVVSFETRRQLAALVPGTRLAVIATFGDFLPTFLTGVHRFAPQVPQVRAAHLADQDLPELLAWCDAAVYASGADGIVTALRPGTFAFEYRHAIDRPDVERTLLPVIGQRRALLRERKRHED